MSAGIWTTSAIQNRAASSRLPARTSSGIWAAGSADGRGVSSLPGSGGQGAQGDDLFHQDRGSKALNAGEVDELVMLVRRLRRDGLTVLVIEHNVRAIRAVADRVVAMNAGQIISEGSAENVFSDPGVVESYLGQQSQA